MSQVRQVPHGLFLGRATVDVISILEAHPPADGKIRAKQTLIGAGGPAINAAVTFSALGGLAHSASSLGGDVMRNVLDDDAAQYGINLLDLSVDDEFSTPVSMVFSVADRGTRTIVNDARPPSRKFVHNPAWLNRQWDVILLDQYEAAFVHAHADKLRALRAPIILDGGSIKDETDLFLDLADIPIVSETFHPDGPEGTAEMFEKMGFLRWAVTLGAAGVLMHERGSTETIPAGQIEAVDTMGAGDVFHGAFAWAWSVGKSFREALEVGVYIAQRSCQHAGTRAWIKEYEQRI